MPGSLSRAGAWGLGFRLLILKTIASPSENPLREGPEEFEQDSEVVSSSLVGNVGTLEVISKSFVSHYHS